MHYLVVAFMIFLLPLRGWAGDVMAMQMATQMATHDTTAPASAPATAPAGSNAEPAFVYVKSLPADCANHPGGEHASSSVPSNGDGETCQACQACHTVALSSSTVLKGAVIVASVPPLVTAAQFTSADTALGQKPPIS